MDTIIGLGQAGCAIATQFASLNYPNIIRIDCETQEEKINNCIDILIPKQSKAEDYENKPFNFKKHFKKIKGNILFIVSGGGSISLASLNILSNLKEKCKINVLYIQPDIRFLGAEAKLKEKTVYNIFQEYARSGLFERLYLVSNLVIEKAMGGVSIIKYYEIINSTVASTFNMLISFQKMKSITNSFSDFPIGARISTFGLFDVENNEEKLFFDLDSVTDSIYYFAYNESVLKEDTNLLKEIKDLIINKIESGILRVSYGVYATNYKTPMVVCLNSTSLIQN